MTSTYEDSTGKEKGLIKSLSSRNFSLARVTKKLDDANTTALAMIDKLGGDVFEFAGATALWQSANYWSKISDYTNKKGVVSKAHFSPSGKYVGRAKDGDKPILCKMMTPITTKHFVWKNGKFTPKPLTKKLKICE